MHHATVDGGDHHTRIARRYLSEASAALGVRIGLGAACHVGEVVVAEGDEVFGEQGDALAIVRAEGGGREIGGVAVDHHHGRELSCEVAQGFLWHAR